MSDHPAVELLKFQIDLAESWDDKERAADLVNLLGYIRKLENQLDARKAAATGGQESEAQAVGEVYTMEPLIPMGAAVSHAKLFKRLPAGTKLYLAPPSAPAIDAAAKMQAAEVCKKYFTREYTKNAPENIHEEILALIPQDGRTALAECRKQVLLEAGEDTARLDFWISLDSSGREKLRSLLFNADGTYHTTFREAIDELRCMAEGEK